MGEAEDGDGDEGGDGAAGGVIDSFTGGKG
jgi:hypothetical protein